MAGIFLDALEIGSCKEYWPLNEFSIIPLAYPNMKVKSAVFCFYDRQEKAQKTMRGMALITQQQRWQHLLP